MSVNLQVFTNIKLNLFKCPLTFAHMAFCHKHATQCPAFKGRERLKLCKATLISRNSLLT